MNIVIASHNEDKVKEFRKMLFGFFDNILSLNDLGITKVVDETGETFAENAYLKAKEIKALTEYAVLADDSGLGVEVLNGAPGILSARYAGENASAAQCRKKLLSELADKHNRRAKFVCALCYISETGKVIEAVGETFGEITDQSFEDKGSNGFGYDCIFFSYDLDTTFALCSIEQKNKVSHRSRAICELLKNF